MDAPRPSSVQGAGRADCPHGLPPRFCLQLCPPAWPDYLNVVEAPGPPQRLHPPPDHGCTRSWGKGAESQTGETGWMWLSEQRLQRVNEFSCDPTLDLVIPFPEVQPEAIIRGPSRAGLGVHHSLTQNGRKLETSKWLVTVGDEPVLSNAVTEVYQ